MVIGRSAPEEVDQQVGRDDHRTDHTTSARPAIGHMETYRSYGYTAYSLMVVGRVHA